MLTIAATIVLSVSDEMKILIASESYKGSLSSLEVSKRIQKGFK